MSKNIAFLVDGGPLLGMGHISRSIRLAKELLKLDPQVRIHFYSAGSQNAGANYAANDREPAPVRPAISFNHLALPEPDAANPYRLLSAAPLEALSAVPFDTCVVDSFRYTGADLASWAGALRKPVFVFDGANRLQDRSFYPAQARFTHECDYLTVINTNYNAPDVDYPAALRARGLFGPHYDTFDQRLFTLPRPVRSAGDDRFIFTSFGGSDDGCYLGPLYQTLLTGQAQAGEVLPWRYLVHTPNAKAQATLDGILQTLPAALRERVEPLTGFSIVDVLARSDAYLGAAGLTAQEAAAARMPALAVMSIIENQHEQLKAMEGSLTPTRAFYIRDFAEGPRTASMQAMGQTALTALRQEAFVPLPPVLPGGLPRMAAKILSAHLT